MDGNSDHELNTLAGHEANPRKNSCSQSGPELSRGEGTNHVDHMGYDVVRVEESNKQLPEAKKEWADSLNEKINTGKSWSRLSNGANTSEEELDRDFFAKFEDKKEKKRKNKAKKFGLLLSPAACGVGCCLGNVLLLGFCFDYSRLERLYLAQSVSLRFQGEKVPSLPSVSRSTKRLAPEHTTSLFHPATPPNGGFTPEKCLNL
ncbi:hypothetical protein V6N11_070040 [Hibiscus sabdariffa]|uniref:Uncharacterized protein n=1 Tax=Hibiscus sabdariffa TaxID=183260 RepID=A0ABR2QDU2_9ROSI